MTLVTDPLIYLEALDLILVLDHSEDINNGAILIV